MDEYQYPLFFEAKELTDREKDKIKRHFKKKRDSGGGECGQLEKVGDDTYKICFKAKEDQERVLQRQIHTILLPSGELRLTVTRTDSPHPSTSTAEVSPRANTKCLEKIFHLDIFLLSYLRDSPKASKVLKKQLAAIGCTVEFDFDEEEVVVRGDVEKGLGGAFSGAAEKWELQVDRVFISLTESYCCYHVLEPKQVKILQRDHSFVNDDIKLYLEGGYAVVVGEVRLVKERIGALEKSLPTQKEVPVVEKQYKLIEEEFIREMHTHCPEVQLLRRNAVIILEGPDKEVQSGSTKLDELIKKVKEKRVKFPPALMSFILSSGAILKYQARFQQCLRSPVSLDAGSDLVLSSLSAEALSEAEAALSRDLSMATVQLQGAAAVPPEIEKVKEILIKAKNEANTQELRVDISFIPGPTGGGFPSGTKVQLVGYSENVNMIKEVLHDYQMNQVGTQEIMNLPHSDMVECFDKIIDMIGIKLPKLTLTASHFPYPCVLVSGPRCLVQEAQQALNSTLTSLVFDTLILDGPGALQYFHTEGKAHKELVEKSYQVLIRELQVVQSPDAEPRFRSMSSPSPTCVTTKPSIDKVRSNTVGSVAVNKTSLDIKLGNLIDEQVNVLVVPMLNRQLTSTKIGKCLLSRAGDTIKSKFDLLVANRTIAPGDVLQVDAPPSLGCSKLFFIECLPWDGARGKSVQALGNGLKTCLDLCVQQGLCSVAFPVIGPGILLKYPLREAIQVLTEKIRQFGLSASCGSLTTIHIVIKPDYPDSEECYHDVYRSLRHNMNQGGQAIFRCLISDLDDITVTVGGGVQLQLVFGDITNETTDAVVNTTDFVSFHYDGVCKDILTVAGPEVEAELKNAKVSQGEVFVSQSGSFHCKAIFHVCGQRDKVVIEQLVCRIIEHCETFEFKSVAIPAICAGVGGLEPGVVAAAIIRGVKAATSANLCVVVNIRLILNKINVFLAFKEETMQMFATAVINRVLAPPLPHTSQPQPLQSMSVDFSILCTSQQSTSQQSIFLLIGLTRSDVDKAMKDLKGLYQGQCSTQTFKKEELAGLNQGDIINLKQQVDILGLYVQEDGQGGWTVSGLTSGVHKVMHMIHDSLHGSLRREVRVREEEDLYGRIAWCIMRHNSYWERLPKTANHKLEKNDTAGGIMDAQGVQWSVDLQNMEATRLSVPRAKLKRIENLPDFTFPLYWDNMAPGEVLKVVELLPSCPEYRAVKEAFKRTVTKTVMKIERLQNVHLRRGYEAQKKHISDKNRHEGGAQEKLLYHGTTQDNCTSIMNTGFNSRFSGQNATAYGEGTYFAVNANYSAQPIYSRPAVDGSQLMFVARVLTGIYTLGQKGMRVPPLRNPQQQHDRFDSAVDKIDNPSMYIVFHDNQAYPDYLITFK